MEGGKYEQINFGLTPGGVFYLPERRDSCKIFSVFSLCNVKKRQNDFKKYSSKYDFIALRHSLRMKE
jgi:hypothetical protein